MTFLPSRSQTPFEDVHTPPTSVWSLNFCGCVLSTRRTQTETEFRTDGQALAKGVAEKAAAFVERGSEVYAQA